MNSENYSKLTSWNRQKRNAAVIIDVDHSGCVCLRVLRTEQEDNDPYFIVFVTFYICHFNPCLTGQQLYYAHIIMIPLVGSDISDGKYNKTSCITRWRHTYNYENRHRTTEQKWSFNDDENSQRSRVPVRRAVACSSRAQSDFCVANTQTHMAEACAHVCHRWTTMRLECLLNCPRWYSKRIRKSVTRVATTVPSLFVLLMLANGAGGREPEGWRKWLGERVGQSATRSRTNICQAICLDWKQFNITTWKSNISYVTSNKCLSHH